MRMPRETYTISVRPADPPAMRLAVGHPMPPGYTPTIPIGGPPKPPPTSIPVGFRIAPINVPPTSWWRENIDRTEAHPWLVFLGIITAAGLVSVAITAAVLR